METLAFLGIDIAELATGGGITVFIAGIIVALLKNRINIKKYLGFGTKITKELGEALLETSDVLAAANRAIREDNTLAENSVADVVKEGKEARIEWKDVIMIVKPKKKK